MTTASKRSEVGKSITSSACGAAHCAEEKTFAKGTASGIVSVDPFESQQISEHPHLAQVDVAQADPFAEHGTITCGQIMATANNSANNRFTLVVSAAF